MRETASKNVPQFLPASWEIVRECQRIQATWSEAERQRRAGYADRVQEVRVERLADVEFCRLVTQCPG